MLSKEESLAVEKEQRERLLAARAAEADRVSARVEIDGILRCGVWPDHTPCTCSYRCAARKVLGLLERIDELTELLRVERDASKNKAAF